MPIEQNYVDCFTLYSYNGDITYTINNAKNYSVYSIGMFDFNLKKIDCTYTDNSISFSNTNNCRILIYDNATISDMNQNNFNEIADFYVIMYPLFNFTGKQPIHVFYNSKDISPSKEELNQYFNKQVQQIYIDYCEKNGDKFEETFDLGFTTITISFPEFEFHPVSSARLALVKSNCNEDRKSVV